MHPGNFFWIMLNFHLPAVKKGKEKTRMMERKEQSKNKEFIFYGVPLKIKDDESTIRAFCSFRVSGIQYIRMKIGIEKIFEIAS